MTVIPGPSLPLKAAGKRVERWDESGHHMRVEVSGSVRRSACPHCLCRSAQVHSRYQRQLAELPSFGQRVMRSAEVRQFKCINPNCARRTFSEKLNFLAAPHATTERVCRSLGYTLRGAAAVSLACRLGIGTGGDTVIAGSLARHFLGLIQGRGVCGFDRWLAKASDCTVPERRAVVASIRADLAEVRAAFTSPWSSGRVEGQVNRLKFLKRQMFGRAKLDLLRLRVLHPN